MTSSECVGKVCCVCAGSKDDIHYPRTANAVVTSGGESYSVVCRTSAVRVLERHVAGSMVWPVPVRGLFRVVSPV